MAIHLRMTGSFDLVSSQKVPGAHVHMTLDLDDGRRLMFHDPRKFGRIYLTFDIASITGSLGPEPLSPEFTAKKLAAKIRERRRQLKPLLLDQSFIAGMGNIYVDEALWGAGISPVRPANTLVCKEIKSLHRSIRSVLRQGIRNAGTSLGVGLGNYRGLQNARGRNSSYLKVFRRTGQPCPRCGQAIERMLVGQRSTHFCGQCQK